MSFPVASAIAHPFTAWRRGKLKGMSVPDSIPAFSATPPSTQTLPTTSARHRVLSRQRLLDGWSPVERVYYEQRFRDGTTQVQDRDLNARGDGVTVLLYSRERGTVLLLRQPRIVATLRGDPSGETLEACSGLLEGQSAEESARLEVQQETGFLPLHLTAVASVYGSPGGSLEVIHLFTAEFTEARDGTGGGLRHEGEDIEVLEMLLTEALALMRAGVIRDARTMLLLQHVALAGVLD